MFDTFLRGFGQFFYFLYNSVGFESYGLTIIIFTILIKLALMPLTLKSLKSTQKMSGLAPEIEKIKKKYKNDQQKQSAEIQKLYKENNVSCMGGCLPMLLQFPILIALYNVFRGALTYIVGIPKESVALIAERIGLGADMAGQINELHIIDILTHNPDQYNLVADLITQDQLLNLQFLGLNLGRTPSYNPSVIFGPEMSIYLPLLIIPIIGVVATIFSQKLMQPNKAKQNTEVKKKTPDQPDPSASMQKMMKFMMPGMTLYFSFIFPAALGLYWVCTYIFQIGQQTLVNKMNEKEKQEAELKKIKQQEVAGNGTKKEPIIVEEDEVKESDSKKDSNGGKK